MGEVYRARDAKLDRDVAIKVLPDLFARDSDCLARFEREAKAVATLSHPNILSIFDLGTDHGTAYAVTELLEGETLRERLEAGALPQRTAVEYAGQIAAGLAAAHDKGIAHRDITIQLRVACPIDLAHPPCTDLAEDVVATEARAGSEGQTFGFDYMAEMATSTG